MKRIQYYDDVFSLVYDVTLGPIHRQHRIDAVELLHLRTGQTVLDVPCGTGANFPFLNLGVGRSGQIVGCDYSPGMLARARAKIEKAGWDHVKLVETDARLITRDLLGTLKIDAVICTLGMSVMPDWELVFERTYDLLEPGGRYVVMDLFLEGKRTSRFADAFSKVIANADSTRRFWEPLEARVLDYETREDPCFGGVALTVAGTKPLD
jgi:ubiquinone/menaquinone biosynthesis C-methylase UbiE